MVNVYEFVKPTKADAEYIAANLRDDNRQEIICAVGDNALSDILHGLAGSDEVGCLRINGKAAAIYGVQKASVLSDDGLIWLLMTAETEQHKVFVGRHTKRVLQMILQRYSKVYNWCDAGNENILKWLRWLGAKMEGPIPHGVYGVPHYYFEFVR